MPKVCYYLQADKVNKQGFSPIKAVVTINYKEAKKVVGHIKKNHWDKNKQRAVKQGSGVKYNEYKEINKELDNFSENVQSFLKSEKEKGNEITAELLKEYFKSYSKGNANNHTKTIWEAWDEYLQYIKLNKAASTVKNHTTTRNYFKEFETNTGTKVSFNNITTAFGRKFEAYVLNDKQQHNNYLSTLLRRFKAFLNWCIDSGYYTGAIPKNFTVTEKPGTVVTLSVDEFNQLYKHEFKSQRLERVRDIFCFGSLTGLRIGDLKRLTRDNIQNGFIVTYMQKVKLDEPLHIPILAQAQKIIDKYQEQYFLLPQLSEQKFNSYIKEAAKEAGITAQVPLMSFKTSKGVETMATKDELIHAHMTRKTFATLAYRAGIDIETIKKITGIKQEKTIQRYLRIETDTLAEKMKAFSNLIGE